MMSHTVKFFVHSDGSVLYREPTHGMHVQVRGATTFAETVAGSDYDPRTDFQGGEFTDIDMGDVDITGWDLRGARFKNVDMSQVRNIQSALFDNRTAFDNTKLPEGVTADQLVN